ncbi:Guanyl-specific ribonuclease F1 [Colletotrichum tanaceti]|uniref:ribonuclease T1 n=1 Tax=Colletotrichum tanaceti TaxID=1306861 RepID=A0A4U6X9R7_9PEZI|nr:Guanyl-specific ribonuclease F1 [Colletotrichum tanaceti]TKW52388.1 Guanyl-specific ribonuclease F1 [Colletotrichum tanaceti]
MQLSLVLVSLFALAAQAAPTEPLQKRATTCGSTYYTTAQVNAASNAACNHVRAGTVAGTSTYPHRYNNYEGFSFDVNGPWYEFPIRTSGVYTGGSPGADRVVINASCGQAGQITHTGASGNAFVGCTGTS